MNIVNKVMALASLRRDSPSRRARRFAGLPPGEGGEEILFYYLFYYLIISLSFLILCVCVCVRVFV